MLRCGADTTVSDLYVLLQRSYDGNPDPATQTLIYGGKILRDTSLRLSDVLPKPLDVDAPHSMHLVVRTPPHQLAPDSSAGGSSAGAGPHGGPRSSVNAAAGAGRAPPGSAGPSMPATPALSRSTSTAPAPGPAPAGATHGALARAPAAQAPGGEAPQVAAAGLLGPAAAAVPLGALPYPHFSGVMPAATASGSLPGPAVGAIPTCFLFNPVAAAAYQAAYTATLAAAQRATPAQQHGQAQTGANSSTSSNDGGNGSGNASSSSDGAAAIAGPQMAPSVHVALPPLVPMAPAFVPPAALYYPQLAAYYQLQQQILQLGFAAMQQQQQAGDRFPMAPLPAGVPVVGVMPPDAAAAAAAMAHAAAAAQHAWPPGARRRLHAVRNAGQGAAGAAANAGAPVAAWPPAMHMQMHQRPARVVTLHISVRTLMQLVVFAVVLYRHCTWQRICVLAAVAAALWVLDALTPLRQLVSSLLAPAAQQPGMAGPGMQQRAARPAEQHQQQQAAGAPHFPQAPSHAATPPAAANGLARALGAARTQPRLLREAVAVLSGFVASMLPGFNAEGAAALAGDRQVEARG